MKMQDKFVKHFEEAGYQETKSSSKKYRKMVKGESVIWLGNRGAVRTGRTISESMPLMGRVLSAIKKTIEAKEA